MGVWGRRLRRRPQTPSSSPLLPRFGGEEGQGGMKGSKAKDGLKFSFIGVQGDSPGIHAAVQFGFAGAGVDRNKGRDIL